MNQLNNSLNKLKKVIDIAQIKNLYKQKVEKLSKKTMDYIESIQIEYNQEKYNADNK